MLCPTAACSRPHERRSDLTLYHTDRRLYAWTAMRNVLIITVVAMWVCSVPASSDTVTCDALADAFVNSYGSQTSTNFGGYPEMYLAALHGGTTMRLLTAFDTANLLPEDAIVQSVNVRLVFSRTMSTYRDPITAPVYRVAPEDRWTEATVTWDNQPGIVGEPLGTATLTSSLASMDSVVWELGADAWEATDWFSLMFFADEEGNGTTDAQYSFFTRESAPDMVRLQVHYEPGGEPVPEPSTIALLALGLGTMVLRRLHWQQRLGRGLEG